jgi:hypothetical protein
MEFVCITKRQPVWSVGQPSVICQAPALEASSGTVEEVGRALTCVETSLTPNALVAVTV